ncbi:DUF262 domain-containing protein [Methylobacter sp.]|uniref:DUF262 domain-containing protein n=1 Tax=Methylobacter sp. TaxID=2051955 RepID=UPI003DA4FC6F
MNEENTDNSKLCLKTIYELLGENFYIPAYQRGYRWSAIQVKELLDDIWEFSQNDGDKASFYCLQPVVVVQSDGHWEVVDGQQRLTTLYVILHYLEKEHLRRELNEAYKKPIFSLEYETRKGSQTFLKNIQESSADTTNIDFYHIAKAYEEVDRWFRDRDYNDNNVFLGTLLAKPDTSRSVQVIWYDLTDECKENDYAVDVFSRINIGKIPLTNAELVKALFLQSSHFHREKASLKQIQIATEWDAIEKSLQDPSFWYFIYKPQPWQRYDSRIEYIFDLMKKKPSGAETFHTFHEFNAAFKASKEANGRVNIDPLWKEVKDYFLTFDEWYRDRDLYHLIGFLVDCGHSVRDLKAKSEENNSTKTDFKAYLKKEIRKEVNCQLDELGYGDKELRKVLLLFNIQTLLSTKEADVRFPFDRYKKENWDIEHIRSQTDKEITGVSRREWAKDVLEYFADTRDHTIVATDGVSDDIGGFISDLRKLLNADKIDDSSFKSLYEKIASYFKEDEVFELDGVGNLALLDATTNRSYKNAMFPIKRRRIIHNDMNGVFVPICTKNVFMKFYSKKLGEVMYWKESDADEYLNAIKGVLQEYLPDQQGAHE